MEIETESPSVAGAQHETSFIQIIKNSAGINNNSLRKNNTRNENNKINDDNTFNQYTLNKGDKLFGERASVGAVK